MNLSADGKPNRPIEKTFHYCPDCGSKVKVVGAQPFRCDVCGYTHFFGPVAAVGGLIVNDNNKKIAFELKKTRKFDLNTFNHIKNKQYVKKISF